MSEENLKIKTFCEMSEEELLQERDKLVKAQDEEIYDLEQAIQLEIVELVLKSKFNITNKE